MTNITLYPHQEAVLNWNTPEFTTLPFGQKRFGLFYAPRTGKTFILLAMAEKFGVQCLIVVPKGLKSQWEEHAVMFGGNHQVITKETFRRDHQKLPRYDAVIIDECFKKGTKVLTIEGYKNIEDIKIGEQVANAIGTGTVTHVFSKKVDLLYKISLSNGKKLEVTGNHPLFTKRGWIKVSELLLDDVLLQYNYIHDNMSVYGKTKRMSNLQESFCSCLQIKKNKNLWDELWAEVSIFEQPNKKQIFFGPDEEKQPYGQSRNKIKSTEYIKNDWSQTKNSRRKRTRNASCAKDSSCGPWCRMVCRTCSCDKKDNGISIQLQDRHCKPEKNDSYRSRWEQSLCVNKTTTRQKKRKCSSGIRVESIQIQKSRNNEKFTVYNLEVSGHPSYVVSDVLAHNCHHMANIQSKLTKSMLWYLREHNPTYRWPATGTPYRSSAMNIYAIGQILGKNWNYWTFFTQFFTQVNMGPRKVPMARKGPHIDALLEDYIKSIGITLSIEAVYDMPLQHKHEERFTLTLEQQKACLELNEPVNIARFTKLHAIENGFLYGDGYTENQTFPSKKTDRIIEITQAHDKIAIVCRYTHQIELYKLLLAEQTPERPVYVISGQTPDRAQVVKDIEAAPACVVLIQAQCSEGFSLASIDTMVFASLSFSHVDHIQMLARIVNLTKTRENHYHYLISGDIDNAVYKAIMRKQDFHIGLYA